MCDVTGSPAHLSVDVSDSSVTGEVLVTKESGHVELQVSGPAMAKPVVYAFDSSEQISGFCTALAADMGVDPSSVEIRTPSGAAMSLTMSHNFAWKPGRRMAVGEQLFVVSIVTVDDGELDNFSPSVSGRRPNVRLAQAPAMKYMVISGGVVSGLGKGITASSLGVLMRSAGYRVTSIKIDPYLNVDAGTMSPFEHGEVFTLDDGGEADLDLYASPTLHPSGA